jgi:hypothetical protein
MTDAGVDSAFSLCGAETRSWAAIDFGFGLDQNGGEDSNAAQQCHVSMSPNNFIMERWLSDPNCPPVLSAKVFEFPEYRKRALGEIDGIYAGLTFLDKLEQDDLVQGAEPFFLKDLEDLESRFQNELRYIFPERRISTAPTDANQNN